MLVKFFFDVNFFGTKIFFKNCVRSMDQKVEIKMGGVNYIYNFFQNFFFL